MKTRWTGELEMATARRILKRFLIVLFLLMIAVPVLWGTVGNIAHKSYLAAFAAACLILLIVWCYRAKTERLRETVNELKPLSVCLLLSLFCLFANGIFAIFFRPEQAADYRTFFQVARDLSAGQHPGMKDYVAMFPHILGYSAFLSIFLRIFGQNLGVAVALNVLLTTVSGILLFYLVLELTDTFSAACVYLLWSLCPSKMFYNTMSLSEPYYTCLILLFFWLVSRYANHTQKEKTEYARGVLSAVFCGLLLALVQSARPIAMVPIIALIIWIAFFSDQVKYIRTWQCWTAFAMILIICYTIAGNLWQTYAAVQLEQEPPAVPGYSIYVGFNPETNGSYSEEDMELFQNLYFGEYERNAVAVQKHMMEEAKHRIVSLGKGIPRLILYKMRTLLSHDEGGAYYARESLTQKEYSCSCLISNIWYYLICCLALLGAAQLWGKQPSGISMIAVLFVIGLVTAQLLVEVAARYHYAAIPMLLLIGGNAIRKSAVSEDAWA